MSDVEIEVRVIRDEPTDRAILVQETPSGPKIWLPRQFTEIEYADQRHERVTVTIPEWLAEREGLI